MKYIIILADGMADLPILALNGKTPMMVAKTPNLNKLMEKAEIGLVKTVPEGMKPGSDVANLSVLGYNPKKCYTGRSPLEAVSIGVNLKDTDVTARANLVTLSDEAEYEDKTMIDYSAGEISTKEAVELINYLKKYLDDDEYTLYPGISYRHCLIAEKGEVLESLTPPHDITGKPIKEYLPKGVLGEKRLSIMKKSYELLKDHPVNINRIKLGKRPANSVWLWGEGTKPALEDFYTLYGKKGAMISAVDLLKGIARSAGMQVVEVEGATGNYDTNFSGKAEACVKVLKDGADFVYVHVEAPDECGHHGDLKNKIYSIEQIDEKIIGYVVHELEKISEPFAILVTPDHPTPISIMTHSVKPVPYLLYNSTKNLSNGAEGYSEEQAESTGLYVEDGYKLINKLFS